MNSEGSIPEARSATSSAALRFGKTEAWPTGPGQLVGLGRMHEGFAVRKLRMGAEVIDMGVRRKDESRP